VIDIKLYKVGTLGEAGITTYSDPKEVDIKNLT
jgi:hypothetical protein